MENSAVILVVDDERPIRRFLRTSLAMFGNTIHEAANGQEAIQMVALHHPDLVILDLSLPDMELTGGIICKKRLSCCLLLWGCY